MKHIALLAAIAALATAAVADVTGMTHKIAVTRQGSHDIVQGVGSAFVPWSTQPNGTGSYSKVPNA